jgi:two-component system, NarL family, response regulator LiaR
VRTSYLRVGVRTIGVIRPVMARERPLRVAVANDYELVVAGLAALLRPFHSRVEVTDAVTVGDMVDGPVDIVLYDTFGRVDDGIGGVKRLLDTPGVGRVALYTMAPRPPAVRAALEAGAAGVLTKARPASALVDGLERVACGERIVDSTTGTPSSSWPGAGRGLTARQSEVVALLLQGLSNLEIAEALFVDVNTVKTHLRHAYKALGVRSRAQALALLLGEPSDFHRRELHHRR